MTHELSESPEQTDAGYMRVDIPNLFPHFKPTGEKVHLDLPKDLDANAAISAWERTGGQVRTYGNGSKMQVHLQTYGLVEWLVRQKGARPVHETDETLATL